MEHGYDIDLESGEEVDAKYICPVCLFVMRNPMQTGCGHRFCRACILKACGDRPWGKCPVDKTIFRKGDSLFSDVAMHREIMSLKVKCKNNGESCLWTGELRDLEGHIGECEMEEVRCPLSCGAGLRRGQVEDHKSGCPQRYVTCTHCDQNVVFSQLHKHELLLCDKFPVTCKLCGEQGIQRADIAKHVDTIQGTCPQASVSCKFLAAGCHFQNKRLDMPTHYEDNLDQHMSLLMGRIAALASSNDKAQDELTVAKRRLADYESLISEHTQLIEKLKDRTRCGCWIWKLDLSDLDTTPNMVLSPPFYSSCPGYQMRLRIDFNGVREGESYYSSIFVVLQRGEFDAELPFPFNGQVRVSLLSQAGSCNKQNVSSVIQCADVPRNISGCSNARANSRGRTRFVKKSELFSQSYCRHRVMYFEVSMVRNCENCNAPVVTNLAAPVPTPVSPTCL